MKSSKNQLESILNVETSPTFFIFVGDFGTVDTFIFLNVLSSVSTNPFPFTKLAIVFSALSTRFITFEYDGSSIVLPSINVTFVDESDDIADSL